MESFRKLVILVLPRGQNQVRFHRLLAPQAHDRDRFERLMPLPPVLTFLSEETLALAGHADCGRGRAGRGREAIELLPPGRFAIEDKTGAHVFDMQLWPASQKVDHGFLEC